MANVIEKCRICGGQNLKPILNLGKQTLTGIFPRSTDQILAAEPLELVRCDNEEDPSRCGLVQLRHSCDPVELYGNDYGYRSGLNSSMLSHLHDVVHLITSLADLKPGDTILDIGSNDGSLLSYYPEISGVKLVGIDPTGLKFQRYYQDRIHLIPTFFSAAEIKKHYGNKKIKVVTSISMFYDLESPMQFIREINEVLDDEGIWLLEQSYMPSMLEVTAYDTICHEHLEYYGLKQIKWMADRVGLKIIYIELNATNGGSFFLSLAKKSSHYPEAITTINQMVSNETSLKLHTDQPYREFASRVEQHKRGMLEFFNRMRTENRKILGYGASTKGNVILQYCGLGKRDLPYIAEVNPDKFRSYTPGTLIPIISEKDAHAMHPEYFFVLPWHFRASIISREQDFLRSGGKLAFPLPSIEIVSE